MLGNKNAMNYVAYCRELPLESWIYNTGGFSKGQQEKNTCKYILCSNGATVNEYKIF